LAQAIFLIVSKFRSSLVGCNGEYFRAILNSFQAILFVTLYIILLEILKAIYCRWSAKEN